MSFKNHNGDESYSCLIFVENREELNRFLHVRKVNLNNYSPFDYHTDYTLCSQQFMNAKDAGQVKNIQQLDSLILKQNKPIVQDSGLVEQNITVCLKCMHLARLTQLVNQLNM